MPLDKLKIFGNPNIGVYIFVNNKIALVPQGIELSAKRKIGDILNVEVIEARVAGTFLLGVLIAGNDRVLLVPRIARDEEVEYLKSIGLNVHVVHTTFTALGNVILANSKAAILHPELEKSEVKELSDLLGIRKLIQAPIAGIPTVGSVAVITDKGGVVHPDVSDEELRKLSEFFEVPVDIGTVNFGVAFIRTGLVANNYGALVGEKTTGPEILRITKALNIG
ncbi:MAG: translation initiation factor IF-6 [Desulfurococcales archaeon]|nr:translation initiation factor IF-6 [Desulfurococcales archaeon]RLG76992.1 MAG: translation initiation factor IF-6 [Thermoprotei archaeon]